MNNFNQFDIHSDTLNQILSILFECYMNEHNIDIYFSQFYEP